MPDNTAGRPRKWQGPGTEPLDILALDHTKMRAAIDMATQRLHCNDQTRAASAIAKDLVHMPSGFVMRAGVTRNREGFHDLWDLDYLTLPQRLKLLGTGKDPLFYLLWKPEFLDTLSVEHTAYVICHEAMHVLLDSEATALRLCGPKPDPEQLQCYNVAADLEIEQLLCDLRDIAPPDIIRLGDDRKCPLLGVNLGFKEGLDTDTYYRLLWSQCRSEPTPLRLAMLKLALARAGR